MACEFTSRLVTADIVGCSLNNGKSKRRLNFRDSNSSTGPIRHNNCIMVGERQQIMLKVVRYSHPWKPNSRLIMSSIEFVIFTCVGAIEEIYKKVCQSGSYGRNDF